MKRKFSFLIMDASCLSSNELKMQLKFNSGEFLLWLCQKRYLLYREKIVTINQHDGSRANKIVC